MSYLKYYLVVLFVVSATIGCSSTYYVVGVDSYTAENPSALETKNLVYVYQNPEADNVMLEREVAKKIEHMLINEGYNITRNLEEADILVNFSYGIGEPRMVTTTGFIYKPGQRTTVTNADGEVVATARSSGTSQAVSRDQTVFDRYLMLMAFDLNDLPNESVDSALWQSIIESSGSSSDLRKVLNYLIVASFEEFGINTGERKIYRISENDRRVRQLIEGN